MRGLLALGVSGGLVPCPSALVVLIAAISQHRIGLGMVLIVSFIWSVLSFLDAQMRERAKDVKVIVSEKFQLPSMMPPSYESRLGDEAARLPGEMAADPAKDVMAWSFVGCQIDPDPSKRTLENILFFFALQRQFLARSMAGALKQ